MNRGMKGLAFLVIAAGLTLSGCGGGGGSSDSSNNSNSGSSTTNSNTGNTGGNTTVTVRTDAAAVMFQDSNGNWTDAVSTDTTTIKGYTFDVRSTTGKFGVAMVCTGGPGTPWIRLWQYTVDEWASDAYTASSYCNASTSFPNTLSGSVTNIGAGNTAEVWIGSSVSSPVTAGSYSVKVPKNGTYDLVAVESDSIGTIVKVAIVRDITVSSANTTVPIIDMSTGATVTQRSINVGGAGFTFVSAYLHTKNGTITPLSSSSTWSELNSGTINGDLYSLAAYDDNSSRSKMVSATTMVGNTIMDLTTIAPFTNITLSKGAHPTISGSYTKSAESPAMDGFSIALDQVNVRYTITVSPGWSGNQLNYTLPDLSGGANWNSAWNLATGTSTSYSALALMLSSLGTYPPPAGSIYEFASAVGTTTF